MNIHKNTEKQIKGIQILSVVLSIIGLLTIGLGFGQWLSIQTMLDAGCKKTIRISMSACQQGMATLGSRATIAALTGVGCLLAAGALMYYLRRNVP